MRKTPPLSRKESSRKSLSLFPALPEKHNSRKKYNRVLVSSRKTCATLYQTSISMHKLLKVAFLLCSLSLLTFVWTAMSITAINCENPYTKCENDHCTGMPLSELITNPLVIHNQAEYDYVTCLLQALQFGAQLLPLVSLAMIAVVVLTGWLASPLITFPGYRRIVYTTIITVVILSIGAGVPAAITLLRTGYVMSVAIPDCINCTINVDPRFPSQVIQEYRYYGNLADIYMYGGILFTIAWCIMCWMLLSTWSVGNAICCGGSRLLLRSSQTTASSASVATEHAEEGLVMETASAPLIEDSGQVTASS